jgi:methionyl-tRNA formyltransferase
MRRLEDFRVIYIGLHPDTLTYINKTPLNVVAAPYLDFLAIPTLNPVSIFFTLAYKFHAKGYPKIVVQFFLFAWTCIKFLSPDFQIRYGAYLYNIIKEGILIFDAVDTDTIETIIRTHDVGLIVVNGWTILPKKIIDMTKLGIINIHPSKLPKYRGALPTLWALKNKDSFSAVSIMKLLPGVDDGPLLSQIEFPILKNDNSIDLEHKIDNILKKHLWSDLVNYISQNKTPIPQLGESSTTDKYMSYRQINWEYEKAEDIVNKILLYPYIEPRLYAYSYIRNRRIYFKSAKLENTSSISSISTGRFVIRGLSLYIKTLSSLVLIRLFSDISIQDSFFILFNLRDINS